MSARLLGLVDAILGLVVKPTVRSATAEFGPTPGARYARELALYTDAELIAMDRDTVLAEAARIRESQRTKAGAR
jgi:hypothetical protein